MAERLPLIGAILIPRYTTIRSDLAEERVREVLFVAVTIDQIWDIAGTSASHIAGETSQKKRSRVLSAPPQLLNDFNHLGQSPNFLVPN